MTALVNADLLKLRRRRGLWWTTLLLGAVLSIIFGSLAAMIDGMDVDGGAPFVRDGRSVMAFVVPVLAAIVGARLGADEHAQQTFRYQVLSGRSREELFASKVLTMVATMSIAVVVTTVALVVMSFVPPPNGNPSVGIDDVGKVLWQLWLPTIAYGCIALGVGALMRATGGAIAIALVLQLIGTQLVAALTLIADFFKYAVLPIAIDRISVDSLDADDDLRVGVAGAIICTVVWVAVFLGLGLYRTLRSED